MQSKIVFKICEGILYSSFYVKEFFMSLFIKSISFYNPIKYLAILYPKLPANLVVDVGTRHSHQILLLAIFSGLNELTSDNGNNKCSSFRGTVF